MSWQFQNLTFVTMSRQGRRRPKTKRRGKKIIFPNCWNQERSRTEFSSKQVKNDFRRHSFIFKKGTFYIFYKSEEGKHALRSVPPVLPQKISAKISLKKLADDLSFLSFIKPWCKKSWKNDRQPFLLLFAFKKKLRAETVPMHPFAKSVSATERERK